MFNRKIAFVDLSTGTITKKDIPLAWREKYLGGRGINALMLYSLVEPGYNPLGPENPLLIGGGWLSGLPGFGPGRTDITAMSPQSGNLASSNHGGFFSPELKYAGFDHLVIRGQSKSPVYLFIKDGNIEIRDAGHLWGKDMFQTQQMIKQENNDPRVVSDVIGIAGENLVRTANIRTGPKNAAGRCGLGAVMGSKRLKAIAVRGTGDVAVKHPKELLAFIKERTSELLGLKWTQVLHRFGTPLLVAAQKNSQYSRGGLGKQASEIVEAIMPKKLEPYSQGMAGCFGCAVQCRHRSLVKEGEYKGLRIEGPEFSTFIENGIFLENSNLESILYAGYLCDRLGLDTSGTHLMIGFAMNMFENGVLTKDHTGMDLTWGDPEVINRLLKDIAHRRGFGDILADGPAAVKRLPEGAEKYMWTVKGNLPLGTSQRIVRSLALAMLVSTVPGHQHRGDPGIDPLSLPPEVLEEFYGEPVDPDPTSYQGRGLTVWWHEMLHAMSDSLGCCRFQEAFTTPHGINFKEYNKLIQLVTGMDIPVDTLKYEIGERILTTERLFLYKMGVGTREHDKLPWIFYHPFSSGTHKGVALDLEKVEGFLDDYYARHGWDNNGVPTEALVEKLGIEELVREAREMAG